MYKTNKQTKKKTGLKILFPKHMLQTLPIPLAQVKTGNRNFIEWNQTNCLLFVSVKEN